MSDFPLIFFIQAIFSTITRSLIEISPFINNTLPFDCRPSLCQYQGSINFSLHQIITRCFCSTFVTYYPSIKLTTTTKKIPTFLNQDIENIVSSGTNTPPPDLLDHFPPLIIHLRFGLSSPLLTSCHDLSFYNIATMLREAGRRILWLKQQSWLLFYISTSNTFTILITILIPIC